MKFLYCCAAALALVACSKQPTTFVVTNSCNFARNGELVEIFLPESQQVEGEYEIPTGKLVDAQGNEIGYQITSDNRLLFLVNVEANASSEYHFEAGEPAPVDTLTTCFFLGNRRKDDFAWENDKAAYRMYGPALLPENPSMGVDLWLKHTSQPSANAMYLQEEGGKPYHIDYGLGIDSYKVGHAAGCGGLTIVTSDGQIWPGGPFAQYEIHENGPLQTCFTLYYDSIQVADKVWKGTITITANAGSQVNKAEVMLDGEAIEGTMIGGGIFMHGASDAKSLDEKIGTTHIIAYAEPANSDQGIYAIHEKMGIDATTLDFGRNYVAVIKPASGGCGTSGATLYVTSEPYTMGQVETYYFGGGWSKRDYATDEEWFDATRQTVEALANPLIVTIK